MEDDGEGFHEVTDLTIGNADPANTLMSAIHKPLLLGQSQGPHLVSVKTVNNWPVPMDLYQQMCQKCQQNYNSDSHLDEDHSHHHSHHQPTPINHHQNVSSNPPTLLEFAAGGSGEWVNLDPLNYLLPKQKV